MNVNIVEVKKIVVFGTGKRGKEAFEIIRRFFGNEIEGFIDNNQSINELDGRKVFRADKFLALKEKNDYSYIIGGKYTEEMYLQLKEAGVDESNIYTVESFLIKYLHVNVKSILGNEIEEKEVIVFDCSAGFLLGGIEKWTYSIGNQLLNENRDIKLYTNSMEYPPPIEYVKQVLYQCIDLSTENNVWFFFEDFVNMVKKYNKVTIVLAHIKRFAYMGMMLKKLFPTKVKIISVIHSSLPYIALENIFVSEYIDKILCVNYDIYRKLLEEKKTCNKVFFKETPISVSDNINRSYSIEKAGALRIGYAARLEIEHKRADLIKILIEWLEKKNCNYKLEIAGNGECYNYLNDFIRSNSLENKVIMRGTIAYSKMHDFWKNQDIAINVSETEGCSLSMLESMACGCVDIITNTVGSDWFIDDGKSGFLIPIGDMELLAKKIIYMENNRMLLPEMGKRAYETIKKKCDNDEYIMFWNKKML